MPTTVTDALNAYESELQSRQMVDFAMLEQTTLERLRTGSLANFTTNIKVIFVDEYQDTNLLQESLYFEMAKTSGAGLTIVGDDDQSLYRFRGATVDLFRDFPSRAKRYFRTRTPKTIFLHKNYRSTPAIVHFVNKYAIFDSAYQVARVKGKPPLKSRPDVDPGVPILGMFRDDVSNLAADLASVVSAIFQDRGLRLPNGDRIRAAAGGDCGDAALLCSSPREKNAGGNRRLPSLLRDELLALRTPIQIFNPRGEEMNSIPVVSEFGGLLLQVIDPDGSVEVAAARSLGDARPIFASCGTRPQIDLSMVQPNSEYFMPR